MPPAIPVGPRDPVAWARRTHNGTYRAVHFEKSRIVIERSACHCEQLPCSRHTLELVFPSVSEPDSGSSHKIDDGSRNEDLSRSRNCLYPLGQVDGNARHVLATSFDLADVKTRSEF